jgi:AraC-like DNA-binding protein
MAIRARPDRHSPSRLTARRAARMIGAVRMTVVLDTSAVAPSERSAFWSAQAARLFAPMGFHPLRERPYAGRLLGHHLGPVELVRIAGDAHEVARTTADIAEHDPERLDVFLVTRGELVVAQGARRGRVRAGDLTSIDTSRPSTAYSVGRSEMLIAMVPKALLGADAASMLARTGRRVPGDTGLARIAAPFLTGVAAGLQEGSIDPGDEDLVAALVGLVAALHGDLPDRRAPRSRAAGLPRIKDYIELHLREPGLGPARIARAHFISTRYLHKLFEPEGTTVAAYIRALRLEGARRDLADPALAGQSIAALAASWGFADPARFSRAFRAVYGCSPTEARTGAMARAGCA